jgi:hypothetical protein
MSRRKKSVAAALLLTTASATAAWMIKRRQDNRRPHVGLYFEDGSMVSLPEHSPQAGDLIELGTEAVSIVRGG